MQAIYIYMRICVYVIYVHVCVHDYVHICDYVFDCDLFVYVCVCIAYNLRIYG